jgi:hypothetical protein
MSWDDVKQIREIVNGMKSAEPPVKPIILKHKQRNPVDLGWVYGLWGFSVQKDLRGEVVCRVDNTKVACFCADKYETQWAVVPDCEHNRKVLTDNAKALPFRVTEGPEDLLKAIEEERKKPEIKKEKPKKAPNPNNDPFMGAKLNKEMITDGEEK